MIASGATRKYIIYVVGEIALVVVGILIALQINNWNELRIERKLELEILNELKLNLESNVSIISKRVDYFTSGLNSSRVILALLDGNLPYHDSLNVHLSKATRGYGGADVISYVGYESLRNNGFRLISNKHLRSEIMMLFENTYRAIISFDETFKLQNAMHKEVESHILYTDNPHSLRPFDFDELVNSKPYYASVTDHANNYAWMREETLTAMLESERVLQLIEEELHLRE